MSRDVLVLMAPPGARFSEEVRAGARPSASVDLRARLEAARERQALAEIFTADRAHLLFSKGSLETQMTYQRYHGATVTDFVTGEDRPACTMHVFALFSSTSELGRTDDAIQLCRVLVQEGVAVSVHAILDGRSMPPKSAQDELERFEHLVPEAKILTLSGRDHCLGDASWDGLVDVQRALSENYEGELRRDLLEALEVGYGAGQSDHDFRPTRIFPFRGVAGDLQCDFAAKTPVWEWTGKDVALLALREGAPQTRLASILTRRGLPADVAERVTVRGRAVITFEPDRIASLTTLPGFDVARALPAWPIVAPGDALAMEPGLRFASVEPAALDRAALDAARAASRTVVLVDAEVCVLSPDAGAPPDAALEEALAIAATR